MTEAIAKSAAELAMEESAEALYVMRETIADMETLVARFDNDLISFVNTLGGSYAAESFSELLKSQQTIRENLTKARKEEADRKASFAARTLVFAGELAARGHDVNGKGKVHPNVTIKRVTKIDFAPDGVQKAVEFLLAHKRGDKISISTVGDTEWYKLMAAEGYLPKLADGITPAIIVGEVPQAAVDAHDKWETSNAVTGTDS